MRGGQASHRYAIRRARNVVQTDAATEVDGGRIAPVLAADAELQFLVDRSALLHGHLDELSDGAGVERDERIGRQYALVDIRGQEAPRVVAREAEPHLREIVRAEREEIRAPRDLVGRQ